MTVMKISLLFFIIIQIMGCVPAATYYRIENQNYKQAGDEDYSYIYDSNEFDIALKIYKRFPQELRVRMTINNYDYDTLMYNPNQVRLYNDSMHYDYAGVYLDSFIESDTLLFIPKDSSLSFTVNLSTESKSKWESGFMMGIGYFYGPGDLIIVSENFIIRKVEK